MLHIHPAYSRIFTQPFDDRTDFKSGIFKLTYPGIRRITSHIIVCMIACYDHKRCYIDFGWLERCYFFYQIMDGWINFDGSDKNIGVGGLFELLIKSCIHGVYLMGCSMSHEYKSFCFFQIRKFCCYCVDCL